MLLRNKPSCEQSLTQLITLLAHYPMATLDVDVVVPQGKPEERSSPGGGEAVATSIPRSPTQCSAQIESETVEAEIFGADLFQHHHRDVQDFDTLDPHAEVPLDLFDFSGDLDPERHEFDIDAFLADAVEETPIAVPQTAPGTMDNEPILDEIVVGGLSPSTFYSEPCSPLDSQRLVVSTASQSMPKAATGITDELFLDEIVVGGLLPSKAFPEPSSALLSSLPPIEPPAAVPKLTRTRANARRTLSNTIQPMALATGSQHGLGSNSIAAGFLTHPLETYKFPPPTTTAIQHVQAGNSNLLQAGLQGHGAPSLPNPTRIRVATEQRHLRKVNTGRRIRGGREPKERDNPGDFYDAPPVPATWGSMNPKTGQQLFQYDSRGRLDQTLPPFSAEQLAEYVHGQAKRGMRIWIQVAPSQMNHRRFGDMAWKCRWAGCPDRHRTILKGFFQVCFDERPGESGFRFDPHHNAMYLHLYCAERCFDLIDLVRRYDVRPDTRQFPKEMKNAFSLTRDHDDMLQVYYTWRHAQLAKTSAHDGPRKPRDIGQADLLWSRLTEAHLERQGRGRQDQREVRKAHSRGVLIDQHRGDLKLLCRLKSIIRKNARVRNDGDGEKDADKEKHVEIMPPFPRVSSKRKRTVDGEPDGEEALCFNDKWMQQLTPLQPQQALAAGYPSKKARHEHEPESDELVGPPRTLDLVRCNHYRGPATRRRSHALAALEQFRQDEAGQRAWLWQLVGDRSGY